MTPSDVQATLGMVQRLWPRCKMGDEEWAVLGERCKSIPIDHAQAAAALRNLLATSDKYPRVALILKALSAAAPIQQRRTDDERADQPIGPEYEMVRWRRMLGLADDHPPGDLTKLWYADGFACSVRLRGFVKEKIIADAHTNLIERAGFSPTEADEWCFTENAKAEEYAKSIAGPEAKLRWANTIRMDKIGIAAIIKRRAQEAEAAEVERKRLLKKRAFA